MNKHQRRKGNVKTASSSRAAELLAQSGNLVPFISFSDSSPMVFNASTSFETSQDEIDPEVRNALKKMRKKDHLTREKGLKELASLLTTVSFDKASTSFPHFTSLFPKLIMDGVPSIRALSVQVLSDYIQLLKKASEKHLKDVLPYVFFTLYDNYSHVAQNADALLNSFSAKNKALEICRNSSVEIALQFINSSHPLLDKNDGEETDAQRTSRITAQGLAFLRNLVENLSDNESRKPVLDIIHKKDLVKQILTQSLQVAGGFFALLVQLLTLKWENVPNGNLMLLALSHLDSSNRFLCQSAADFFLLSSKTEAFGELSLNKAVIPRIISILKRKEIHWENLGCKRLSATIIMVLSKVPVCDRSPLFIRFIDAFFEGLPWGASFNVETWIRCLQDLVKFACSDSFSEESSEAKTTTLEYVLEKVTLRVEQSTNDNNVQSVNKLTHLFSSLVSQQFVSNEKVLLLLRNFVLTLIERLPQTESAILSLLEVQNETLWLQLTVMVMRHTQCTPQLFVKIIETFDKDLLHKLDLKIPLMKEIAAKMDWRNENTALHLLASLIKMYQVKFLYGEGSSLDFQNFYKVDSTVACLRLVKAVLYLLDSSKTFTGPYPDVWETAVKTVLPSLFAENIDLFLQVFDVVLELPSFENVILEFLEKCNFDTSDLLLQMAKRVKNKSVLKIRVKIAEFMLDFLMCNHVSEDITQQYMKHLLELQYDESAIISFVRQQLSRNSTTKDVQNLQTLLLITMSVSTKSASSLIIQPETLHSYLCPLDSVFGVEILIQNEFLCGNWERFILNKEEESTLLKEVICFAINESYFLLGYLEYLDFKTDESEKYFSSLFYIIAVSSLPVIKVVSESIYNTHVYEEVKRKTGSLILYDEKLKHHLLEYSNGMKTEEPSLSFLLALRSLGIGLDLSCYGRLLNDNFSHARRMTSACAAAAGTKLQLDEDAWDNTSSFDWICRTEIITSLRDSKVALEFLNFFLAEGRNNFDEVLFVFQKESDQKQSNALSCAMLRLLSFCSSKIEQMNGDTRDFLCCALIAALESCKEVVFDSGNKLQQVFSALTIQLFKNCAALYHRIKANNSFAIFVEEWNSFFSVPAEELLFSWFMSLPDVSCSPLISDYISSAIHFCSPKTLKKAPLKTRCDIELDAMNYPIEIQSIVVPMLSLLTSPSCSLQFAALRILRLIVKEMLLFENKEEGATEEPEDITKAFTRNMPVICDRLLKSKILGGVSSSFLIWDALIFSLTDFEPIERVPYCHMLFPYLNDVLPSLFDNLPTYPDLDDICIDDSVFLKELSSSEMISQYCFGLFYRTLVTVPALIRQWYTSLPRSIAAVVNSYTTKYISPLVWKTECDKVLLQKFPSALKIRLRGAGTVREIVAEFELDDLKMDLYIELPVNYPLNVPSIENDKTIVTRETMRRWVLQLMLFIAHQNGAIADAITLWARNVEKHIEGAEDCTICMSIVHSSTYKLPKAKCKHCKKKFHTECIRKWFESSRQLTCPLCRSQFR